jgi:hypothetical protein
MLALILCLILSPCILSDNVDVSVRIDAGSVQATVKGFSSDGGRVFTGIRYAQAPVGALRFAVGRSGESNRRI